MKTIIKKCKNRHKWTEEEESVIKEYGGKEFDYEIKEKRLPYLTERQIQYKRYKMGIKGKPTITSNGEKIEYKGMIFTLDTRGKNFINGKKKFLHRVIMEDKIGRKLNPHEIVHHIDGNDKNNHPSNLHLYESHTKHAKGHFSLEKVLMELVRKGYIKFDRNTRKYYIKSI